MCKYCVTIATMLSIQCSLIGTMVLISEKESKVERFAANEKQNCVLAKRQSFGMFELMIYVQLLCIFADKNNSTSVQCIKYVENFLRKFSSMISTKPAFVLFMSISFPIET